MTMRSLGLLALGLFCFILLLDAVHSIRVDNARAEVRRTMQDLEEARRNFQRTLNR